MHRIYKGFVADLQSDIKKVLYDRPTAATSEYFKGKFVKVDGKPTVMLHLAFKQAVKRRIIPSNPCEQADRPKATQYIGTYYNTEELKQLIDCLEGDPMSIVIILAAYYGLRRSEVLGIKWDTVDFTDNKIYIRHKIIENKCKGSRLEGYDVMKNNSSYRSMPLIPFVREALLAEKAKQEDMQRMLRGAYNRTYTEYVCVDAIGNLIKPQYATTHFKVILARNGLKEIRFHDLRYTCASLLLESDINMKTIQVWMGHSSMKTTSDIYAHLDMHAKENVAEALAKLFRLDENDEEEET